MNAEPVRPQSEAEQVWEQEIRYRISQFDAGLVQTVPAAQVFARLEHITAR